MTTLEEMLAKRTKSAEGSIKETKVQALAQRANDGQLSGFHGLFQEPELSALEEQSLRGLLLEFQDAEGKTLERDLLRLRQITKEIKAIHTQSLLLHGERIKQAQELLKAYKEGAFTRWLLTTYGNRQTPYNFLQFYEFFQTLTLEQKKRAEELPRQAIYSLATRKGSLQEKQQFLLTAEGKTKKVLLEEIRQRFPLQEKDRRGEKLFSKLFLALASLEKEIGQKKNHLPEKERQLLADKAKKVAALLIA